MKNDKKWLKTRLIHAINFEALNDKEKGFKLAMKEVLVLIDQLDEPETLSQQWIDEHATTTPLASPMVKWVSSNNLQNLLVPKQEELVSKADELKPVVSQEWFDVIKMYKEYDANLWMVFDEYNLFDDESDDFARAWLAYPNIEVEKEQRYRVEDDESPLLIKVKGKIRRYIDNNYYGNIEHTYELTEQEIKDYDERFWAFAVPVEEE